MDTLQWFVNYINGTNLYGGFLFSLLLVLLNMDICWRNKEEKPGFFITFFGFKIACLIKVFLFVVIFPITCMLDTKTGEVLQQKKHALC